MTLWTSKVHRNAIPTAADLTAHLGGRQGAAPERQQFVEPPRQVGTLPGREIGILHG